ncbi:MAG: ATP-binding protein, partial [Myxococcales bacterium]|nr:ATP-binding protein [Myxococcales bacterium]
GEEQELQSGIVARQVAPGFRTLRNAELRFPDACVEDIETSKPRGLESATVRQLSTCAWIGEHLNVLVTGATGVGKSYVACAASGQLSSVRGQWDPNESQVREVRVEPASIDLKISTKVTAHKGLEFA